MKKTIALFVILVISLGLKAVNPPANLNGESLKTWLKENYYEGKHQTLSYSTARQKMYNYIDNKNNTITGVYSGYQKEWTAGGTGTNPSPINCEHTVPQSYFGEATPMKSDIHHLFPTYGNWNSTRSNYPFAEIDDQTTTKWMYTTSGTSNIPSSNINEYSEYASSKFEPREDHKGNCARAIFYFYTMYPTQAGDISRVANINTLYQWHLNDPVDEAEIKRNDDIETFQGNRNPYIDYPDLVSKAFGLGNTPPSAPSAPALQFSATTTNINLSWTDAPNETGYNLYKSEDDASYTLLANLNEDNTEYNDNAATPDVTYHYYVVAYNGIGNSANSNQVNGTLLAHSDIPDNGDEPVVGIGTASDLFISEYIEGSSYNKAIEVANYTSSTIDLSNYSLKLASNGATSWGNSLVLSGNLTAGATFVISHPSASMASDADANNSSVINFNGDDAIGLFKNDDLIDIVNDLGNPKKNFNIKDQTLVRIPSIHSPNPNFDLDEWKSYTGDIFTFLGKHTITGSTDLVISSIEKSDQLITKVYPNPANSYINIEAIQTNMIEQLEISIFNINGRLVYATSADVKSNRYQSQLPLDGLPSGIYRLRVKTAEKQSSVSFVVR